MRTRRPIANWSNVMNCAEFGMKMNEKSECTEEVFFILFFKVRTFSASSVKNWAAFYDSKR